MIVSMSSWASLTASTNSVAASGERFSSAKVCVAFEPCSISSGTVSVKKASASAAVSLTKPGSVSVKNSGTSSVKKSSASATMGSKVSESTTAVSSSDAFSASPVSFMDASIGCTISFWINALMSSPTCSQKSWLNRASEPRSCAIARQAASAAAVKDDVRMPVIVVVRVRVRVCELSLCCCARAWSAGGRGRAWAALSVSQGRR
mmetsp:Transcript_14667/g.30563  ORF Transcript_14667/g.30563 Transcript_14667/m.30563 type:complete len:205 (+) Transcript_14667:376-990(+)